MHAAPPDHRHHASKPYLGRLRGKWVEAWGPLIALWGRLWGRLEVLVPSTRGVLSDDFTALFSASLDYWGAYTRSIVQSYYA
jgi:hypothetical protein